jgi:transcriptional regulator with XRE-family HTH domain
MRKHIDAKTLIREVRKARGFTLKDVALAINTTPQSIQRMETGGMTVSMEWLYLIAQAMGVDPYELLPHPEADATPERLFVKRLSDAVIYYRRSVPALDDVPLVLMEAVGKLSGLMLECKKGLRPWDDAYAQALAVAACAMRIGVDGDSKRPKLVEDAA